MMRDSSIASEVDLTANPDTNAQPPASLRKWHVGSRLSLRTIASASSSGEDRSKARLERLGWVLFGLGMFVYLFTRLWGIDKFPIYFFTDEAANPLFAQGLFDNGFRNAQGVSVPALFRAGRQPVGAVALGLHPRVQLGTVRQISACDAYDAGACQPAGAAGVALILKQIFKARFWWIGVLLMALAPAWFLHSRTGFETIIAASFYGCFLLCYMLYRTRSPRYLYAAILFGAATFYTYSNGQMIMVVAGVAVGAHRHPLSPEALAHDWAGPAFDRRDGDSCAAVPCRRSPNR